MIFRKTPVIFFATFSAASSLFSADRYFSASSAVFSYNSSWYADEARTQSATVPSYEDTAIFYKAGTAWVTQIDTFVNNLVANGGNINFGKEILNSEVPAYFEVKNKIIAKTGTSWTQFNFGTSFDQNEGTAAVEIRTKGIDIGTQLYSTSQTAYGDIGIAFSMTDSRVTNSLLVVDGDINMGGVGVSGVNTAAFLKLGMDKVQVNGVINLKINGWGYSNINFTKSSVLEVGGLYTASTYGDYTISNEEKKSYTSTIVLKNAAKTDYMYVGSIADDGRNNIAVLPSDVTSVTNVTMDGEGTQRIFNAIKNETTLYKKQSGKYTVKSGKLMFDNSRIADGYRLASLSLEGGKLGTAHYDTSNVGRAYFKTAEFKSGGFSFENFANHNSLETQISDKIVISDSFTKTGANKITVDFKDKNGKDLDLSENILGSSSDYDSIENWVEILTTGSLFGFNLESKISDTVFDANSDFEAIGVVSATTVFKWVATVEDGVTKGYSLQVGFYQVPEPATLAAILGAIALAFAAYRKTKHN